MSIVSVDRDDRSRSLTVVAEFDSPLERVWELWADPRQLERWWGPPDHPATFEELDLRPDGEVTYYMTGPGGRRSHGWWRVISVDPPTSLEFVDRFADSDGTPLPESPTTIARMRLTESRGATRMELRFVFESDEHMAQLERAGAFDVFSRSVRQMDEILAAGPGPTDS
jgi:uncharacterized protein YndB with AHSA1/START domain